MPARAISSATVSFGLVSIPVKLYTATSPQTTRFNMLHKESASRVKQQYIVPSTGEVIARKELVKGFEYSKGQYVIFSEEELKKLEAERSSHLEIVEFVPLASVDMIHVEKTYYLGPDKGGDKAYRLLAESMTSTGKVAVGRWAAKGKEQLVLVRPYKDGLMLHQMYYANEVRAFDEIEGAATFEYRDIEREMAQRLIEELSSDSFQPGKFKDDYAERVKAAVDQKVAGQEIQTVPEVPKAQIVDLFEALKQSLAEAQLPSSAASDGGDGAEEGPGVEKARPREAEAKTGTENS